MKYIKDSGINSFKNYMRNSFGSYLNMKFIQKYLQRFRRKLNLDTPILQLKQNEQLLTNSLKESLKELINEFLNSMRKLSVAKTLEVFLDSAGGSTVIIRYF